MSMQAFQEALSRRAQLRRITLDPDGVVSVESLPPADVAAGLSLDLAVDVASLAPPAGMCPRFEATTVKIVVPLALGVAGPMIDPIHWGKFSAIQTSSPDKQRLSGAVDWAGTIEERVRVKFGPVVTDYHNRLTIDFHTRFDRARVDFELDKCFLGDLAFEEGFFEVEPLGLLPAVTLVSKKALRYQPPSPWCRLPGPALQAILLAWLNAATAEYALRMTTAAASQSPLVLPPGLIEELTAMLP